MDINELAISGGNIPDIVRSLIKICNNMKEPSFTAFLPLLRFEGHPYNLKYHFQLEPLYRMNMPRRMVLMTGRQVGKTSQLAGSSSIRAGFIPYYDILHIEPRD